MNAASQVRFSPFPRGVLRIASETGLSFRQTAWIKALFGNGEQTISGSRSTALRFALHSLMISRSARSLRPGFTVYAPCFTSSDLDKREIGSL